MAYPDCALSLAFEGVSLRRRRENGWIAQAQALFDAPDTRAALDRLRQRAAGPDGRSPVPVLLVLPRDQILYGRLRRREAGRDGAAAVRAALEAKTAYPAEALRFSFERLPDGGIGFAACALETLREAEAFAQLNGFAPRGALAPPRPGLFDAPAWFGTAAQSPAEGWLPRPEGVAWSVADLAVSQPPQPNAARLASARARAQSVARQTPPVRQTAPADDYTPDEQARIDRVLHHATRRLTWPPARTLRAVWMSAALIASLVAVAVLIDRPTPDDIADVAPGIEGTSSPAPASELLAQASDEAAQRLPDPLETTTLEVNETDLWTPERGLMRRAETSGLDALVQPSLDPPVGTDALALDLPEPDTGAPEFAMLTRPPEPRARFDIDTEGLVRPVPGGAATPEGFLVFEGRPPQLPPQRPEALVQARAAAELLAETTPPDARDASEADVAPRRRPEDLTARFERNTLGGRTSAELATLRPVPREAELAAAAAAARSVQTAAVDAALAAAQAAATSPPGVDEPRPAQRPEDLPGAASAQQRAVAAVAAASTAAVAPAPSAQPTSSSEIETAYVAPTRSAGATVVKQATSDRINLRDVNLLGTFGPTSAQRALVRLPSGQVVNVSVGDRFDGGRVSAIGQGEMRYTKGGRPHVLKMPRG